MVPHVFITKCYCISQVYISNEVRPTRMGVVDKRIIKKLVYVAVFLKENN